MLPYLIVICHPAWPNSFCLGLTRLPSGSQKSAHVLLLLHSISIKLFFSSIRHPTKLHNLQAFNCEFGTSTPTSSSSSMPAKTSKPPFNIETQNPYLQPLLPRTLPQLDTYLLIFLVYDLITEHLLSILILCVQCIRTFLFSLLLFIAIKP